MSSVREWVEEYKDSACARQLENVGKDDDDER